MTGGTAPAVNIPGWPECPVGLSAFLKRLMDLVLTVPLLLALSPVLLAVAVAVRLDSPGPALFRQRRIGQGGRPFTILKLRTMAHNPGGRAAGGKDEVAAAGAPPAINLETFVFQVPDDPRITRVGRWLRRTSLDELPQLWNVIRGEMSLVGPRPEVPEIVALYSDEQRRRLLVKPGMTGLAQVTGRGTLTVAESIRYDLEYVDRWSLWLDLYVLVKTIPAVLRGIGAR